MFAFALIPIMFFVGVAVDYQQMLVAQAHLQSGADETALAIENLVGQYIQKNNAYPSQSAIAGFYAQASALVSSGASGAGTLASSDFHVCTPSDGDCSVMIDGKSVTLQPGQVAVRAAGDQSHMFANLLGAPSTVAATAVAGSSLAPHIINYKFQYAKGWYYKNVKLWVVPVGATAPVALATWTYQATNLSAIANPSNPPPYFPSNPVDTGIGTVTTTYAPSTVVDSSGNITLPAYTSLYLTMQVKDSPCPPGETYSSTSTAVTSSENDFYKTYYWGDNGTKTTVQCSGTANSNFDLSMSTNSPTNSNYIYINGVEQPNNAVIPLGKAFPCGSSAAASTTNYYEWEDSDVTSPTGDRDFFFDLTTTCSNGSAVAGNGAPVLIH